MAAVFCNKTATACNIFMLVMVLCTNVCSAYRGRNRASSLGEMEVKLVGGKNPYEGNVYVKFARGSRWTGASGWGLVCDSRWTIRNAVVVCGMLGYTRVEEVTNANHFNSGPSEQILIPEVICNGFEKSLSACSRYRRSRECSYEDAAGVVCDLNSKILAPENEGMQDEVKKAFMASSPETQAYYKLLNKLKTEGGKRTNTTIAGSEPLTRYSNDQAYSYSYKTQPTSPRITEVKVTNGRTQLEGYVEVTLSNGETGTICADDWGTFAAQVVCRQLGNDYAEKALKTDYFRGSRVGKALHKVVCTGKERHLSQCSIEMSSSDSKCSKANSVAGVICTDSLPDLIPSIEDVETSITLQDRYMGRMTCAMEEECMATSGFNLKEQYPRDWNIINRRLLRFSTSVTNNGTADFRPTQTRSTWSYHSCHRHYHSMEVFTHYDIVDYNGVRVAEGHKASFCLEDVKCQAGKRKRYSCSNYANQGISVGCTDVYRHSLDCQWIDITDLPAGKYAFKLTVNPEYLIPELDYSNNAVICQMYYTGNSVTLGHCVHSHG